MIFEDTNFLYKDSVNEYDDFFNMISKIYNRMEDDISRNIFSNRLLLSLTNNPQYMRRVLETVKDWYKLYYEISSYKYEIYIYGAGKRGKRLIDMFPEIKWKALIDKYQTGIYHNCPIIAIKDLLIKQNIKVLISNLNQDAEISEELQSWGIRTEQIIILNDYDKKFSYDSYFDMNIVGCHMDKNKYFVDAGSYLGEDTEKYLDIFFNEEKNSTKVVAFEPDADNFIKCKANLKKYCNVQVRNSALYNADEPVYMEFGKEETCNVVSVSENQIKGESLDTVVGDEPVGFIKMDIEGSEMNALEGAKNTIIKQHPILAISIYHKKSDIWKIPNYVLKLNPDYKFYIRHYSASFGDTVLYAIP